MSDRIPIKSVKTQARFYGLGGWMGFCGGFLMAYQKSCSKLRYLNLKLNKVEPWY